MIKFYYGSNEDSSVDLYSTFRHVSGIWKAVTNKDLRISVADRILKSEKMRQIDIASYTGGKNLQQFCSSIKQGRLDGGQLAFKALSRQSRKIIRLVSLNKDAQGRIAITVDSIGQDDPCPYEKCVHMFHNAETNHYLPLYVICHETPLEEKTIVDANDKTIITALHAACMQLGDDSEAPSQGAKSDEIEEMESMFYKIYNASSSDMPVQNPSSSLGNLSQVGQATTENTSRTLSSDWNQNQLNSGEQNGVLSSELCMPEGSSSFNGSMQCSFDSADNDAANTDQMPYIKLAVDLPDRFRGRTKGEYVRKKSTNKNNQQIQVRSIRYLSDRENHRCLTLLIHDRLLKMYSFPMHFEVTSITKNIGGYSYVNSFMKFKENAADAQSQAFNPFYFIIQNPKELTRYSNTQYYQFRLKLTLVVLTARELMQCNQPFEIFPVSHNDTTQEPIKDKFKKTTKLKQAYDVHNMRLAITLCTTGPVAGTLCRNSDVQYISNISTEDRKHKKLNTKVSLKTRCARTS
ncbi:unnamed protein product [Adineta ricciae]|uniref:Uncharacterized protein n=1 Tax=Adineta ricciae TaxID=249248 RepID=A0A814GG61_ADIRI|nr:unnamed protein product [Adineta ricciae]CAF0995910.1 unnamed protein product [Adineta ricciae]